MELNGKDKVYIIGIGDNGSESCSPKALSLIETADLLFGGERHLEFFSNTKGEKVVVKSNLKEVANRIGTDLGKKRMVVLASGDPLFYGIGKYILNKVPKEKVELLPYISAMQIAFSKAKESWEDAKLVSLHAKPIEDLFQILEREEPKKIGIFTDETNRPEVIAQALLKRGFSDYSMYVCENLEGEGEKISFGNLETVSKKSYSNLNVVILIKNREEKSQDKSLSHISAKGWTIGIPDREFFQRFPEKGLITKQEVRVISLSKMNIYKESVVWDIGAGSGSVSIECALIAKEGKIYAVEKNLEDYGLIQKNISKFNTLNVSAIHGLAPEALNTIPDDPDAVFIGGSSGNMFEILEICSKRLKKSGRIIVNVITIENLLEAWEAFKKLGFKSEATLLQVSRSQPILDITRFAALNPIWVLTAWR